MTVSIMDLPEGAKDSDYRWQRGYADGFNGTTPASDDPVYVSGWCHGHNGTEQATRAESEEAYRMAVTKASA